MKTVTGRTFNRQTVTIDDTEFVNCQITNCELVYSGGPFAWVETDITNCLITLRNASAFTAGFLEKFGLIDQKARWDTVKLEYSPQILAEWKNSTFRKTMN